VDTELPRRSEVEIPRRKVTGYLLATGHPVGGAKAKYFHSRGFDLESPEILEAALRWVAQTGRVKKTESTPWGMKYFVVAEVDAPDGNPLLLGTVWIVSGDGPPLLVTAYPTRR
jgi:hypothetical protein